VEAQDARGLGDVAVALEEHAIDVFPLNLVEGHGLRGHGHSGRRRAAGQRSQDLVRVGRLRQIVRGASANGLDGSGNAIAYNNDTTDGATAIGILFDAVTTSGATAQATIIARDAEVRSADLT